MNQLNKLFKVVFISDIHFGAIKPESLYYQLKQYFLKVLKNVKVDMVVIGGDLFHNIISMNYSTSYTILLFMQKLVNICIENKVKYIRVIQGTLSHDNNQLHNFHIYEDLTEIDFKIVLNVQEEILKEKISILYLPEEYIKDSKEYYNNYFKIPKKYDFIFGHGLIDEVAYYAEKQESEITLAKAPVFKAKELINACRGPIFFGHIHKNIIIRKHIYYSGSFTRWKHGEEEDKGFYICIYNRKSTKYINKFLTNDLAPIYKKIVIDIYENTDVNKIDIGNIEADYIKLVLNNYTNSSYAIDYITNLFKKKNNVKIEIKNLKELKLISKKIEEDDLYDFVFDKSLTRNEIIQKFIKLKYNKDISLEDIKEELRGD